MALMGPEVALRDEWNDSALEDGLVVWYQTRGDGVIDGAA
ncbi:hypothetical protein TevJSym_az00400 [endosymbiont of Tevnia jerichonana (vent Tica)]|jgi:hypothetical protein|uniref:Uncharacterized protein n=2 Tax=sulfur-oxidizing symbionts TaxID=32036 RepID=G2FI50_9GAMM|nr:hypothetical protein TevJSym_az00400 [endosymbiont of Tevnia jerichonana (vent Tica)]